MPKIRYTAPSNSWGLSSFQGGAVSKETPVIRYTEMPDDNTSIMLVDYTGMSNEDYLVTLVTSAVIGPNEGVMIRKEDGSLEDYKPIGDSYSIVFTDGNGKVNVNMIAPLAIMELLVSSIDTVITDRETNMKIKGIIEKYLDDSCDCSESH